MIWKNIVIFPVFFALLVQGENETQNHNLENIEAIHDSTNATTSSEETNPCDVSPPTMPDFEKPGRIISTQKCYEYVWHIKHREEQIKMAKACTKYMTRENNASLSETKKNDARVGDFPHMASIGWKSTATTTEWVFRCAGALISPNFVLMAAHCLEIAEDDYTVADAVPKIVRLGDQHIMDPNYETDNNYSKPNFDISIVQIIKHPQYESPKRQYDLALLEIQPVEFSDLIQPACLSNSEDFLNTEGIATGHAGGYFEASKLLSKYRPDDSGLPVIEVALDFLSSETCDTLLREKFSEEWSGMQEHQLCAGKLDARLDSCQGDSGGPLQVRIPLPQTRVPMYYIVGISSFSYKCTKPKPPGVYTRVSSFVDWIERIVWP